MLSHIGHKTFHVLAQPIRILVRGFNACRRQDVPHALRFQTLDFGISHKLRGAANIENIRLFLPNQQLRKPKRKTLRLHNVRQKHVLHSTSCIDCNLAYLPKRTRTKIGYRLLDYLGCRSRHSYRPQVSADDIHRISGDTWRNNVYTREEKPNVLK